MTDELIMHAFNFSGRTIAFKLLSRGFTRSPTAFSFLVSKHLKSYVASDKCFVYLMIWAVEPQMDNHSLTTLIILSSVLEM